MTYPRGRDYVYDDLGNLYYVIPPLAADQLKADGQNWNELNNDAVNQYVYHYKYDGRNRCTKKKLPGAEWIYYIYDKADRLIFTQDGEQRSGGKNEWLFTIPDALGRIVLTGICKTANGANITIGRFDTNIIKAEFSTTGSQQGYNLKVDASDLTLGTSSILTANYYDNYSYQDLTPIKSKGLAYIAQAGYGTKYDNAQGLLTGSSTALLDGSNKYLYSAMYYDYKGNLIQTKSTNHLDGVEYEYIAYTFAGSPTKRQHVHTVAGKTTTEYYTYTYDHAGRLKETAHQLQEGTSAPKPKVILAYNDYDELGRLKATKANNQTNLTTTYAYNIRSWTNSIANPLFKENLTYTFNGNIATQEWIQAAKTRKYTFAYDNLSRLKSATYTGDGNFTENCTYDKQGNITSLTRYGFKGDNASPKYDLIDNLSFGYTGNQLKFVNDDVSEISLSTSADFKDNSKVTTAEYIFNKNGAMTQDLNKGIVDKSQAVFGDGISYNSLNLPQEMIINNPSARAKNYYTYAATGAKLRVKHLNDPTLKEVPVKGSNANDKNYSNANTTDYVGNKIYEDGILKMILTDNGYYDNLKNTYYFYIKDHLGNNRIVADVSGTSIQSNQYYPFGMAFAEGTKDEQGKQPYKYNSKELDKEHDLNWYDYSARYFSPDVPRFTTMDPLSEKYYSISPYVYVMNNPILYIDPDGCATHVNSLGQVVQITDDGDLGIYMHQDLSKWDNKSNLSTNGKGISHKGETWTALGFADFEHYEQTGEIRPGSGAQIDFDSDWAESKVSEILNSDPTALSYADKARGNHEWDIKKSSPQGVYYGSKLFGKYASARDAGNFAAGAVAQKSLIPNNALDYGFGLYNLSGNSVVKSLIISTVVGTMPVGTSIVGNLIGKYGEDKLSQAGIDAGKSYIKRIKK